MKCKCSLCESMPPLKPCLAYELVQYITQLETCIRDMLKANTEAECAACLIQFRLLLK